MIILRVQGLLAPSGRLLPVRLGLLKFNSSIHSRKLIAISKELTILFERVLDKYVCINVNTKVNWRQNSHVPKPNTRQLSFSLL